MTTDCVVKGLPDLFTVVSLLSRAKDNTHEPTHMAPNTSSKTYHMTRHSFTSWVGPSSGLSCEHCASKTLACPCKPFLDLIVEDFWVLLNLPSGRSLLSRHWVTQCSSQMSKDMVSGGGASRGMQRCEQSREEGSDIFCEMGSKKASGHFIEINSPSEAFLEASLFESVSLCGVPPGSNLSQA